MVAVALLLIAFLSAPALGAEFCVDVPRATPVIEAIHAGNLSASAEVPCCASQPGDAPEAPCAPDDSCCAVCLAHGGKRLAGAPAVPGPTQAPDTEGAGPPEPRAGADHGGAVWHPPRG